MKKEACDKLIGDGVDSQKVHDGLIASGILFVVKAYKEEHIILYKVKNTGKTTTIWFHNMPVVQETME